MAPEKWTRERRRQLTRDALLEAAAEVFAVRGFEGASLDEIAETAGFTRGAIYKHFENKEDLFFAVNDRFNESILRSFDDVAPNRTFAGVDIASVAALWRKLVVRDDQAVALGLEFMLYALRNPELQARNAEHRQKNADRVARYIEKQAAVAGVTLRLPTDRLAKIFLALSDGLQQSAVFGEEVEDLYETFLELVIPSMVDEAPPQR